MPDSIRYHLDEQMDPDIAVALRRAGIDVTTTVEQGLRTSSDEEQWEFVRGHSRVLITDDQDFLVKAASTQDHPGFVYCRRTQHSMGEIINCRKRGIMVQALILCPVGDVAKQPPFFIRLPRS